MEDAREAVKEMRDHGMAGGFLAPSDDRNDKTVGFRCSGGVRWAFPLIRVKERTFTPLFDDWLNTLDSRLKFAASVNKVIEARFRNMSRERPDDCSLCAVSEVMDS